MARPKKRETPQEPRRGRKKRTSSQSRQHQQTQRKAPQPQEVGAGPRGDEKLVPVEIAGIEVQGPVGEPMVIVKEKEGKRIVPIWIGPLEAQALYVGWRKIPTPRPLTPDLLLMVLRSLGGTLERVVLTTVALNTYFARLEVRDATGTLHLIDARPSDAMALAVRTGVPLLATEEMLSRSGIPIGERGKEKGGQEAAS